MPNQNTRRPKTVLVKDLPIALRLMPKELEDAQRIASEMGVSKSKLARLAFLAGLPLLSRPVLSGDLSAGDSSPADFSTTAKAA